MFLVLSGWVSVGEGNQVLLDGVIGQFGVHLHLFQDMDPGGCSQS